MQKYTEYFGERERPIGQGERKRIANDLEFDEDAVERITHKVYNGMDTNRKGVLTQEDLRSWTKAILHKKYPGVPFSEEHFQLGFSAMDTTKDGKVDIDDIYLITLNKVKKENLFIGNK